MRLRQFIVIHSLVWLKARNKRHHVLIEPTHNGLLAELTNNVKQPSYHLQNLV